MSAGQFVIFGICFCLLCVGIARVVRWLCPPMPRDRYYLWMAQ